MPEPQSPVPTRPRRVTRAAVVKAAVLAVALMVTAWFVATHGTPSAADIRSTVRGAGPWAPVAYVAIFASLTLVATPRNVLTTIGAALFGIAAGIVLSWVAALLGAVVAFTIGRALGRDAVDRLTRGRLERVSTVLRDHGTESVLIARLMPVVPFTAVNYGAGVLGVRLSHFTLGTAVGALPGSITYAALGAYGLEAPWALAGLAAVLLLLAGAGAVAGRRVWRRGAPGRAEELAGAKEPARAEAPAGNAAAAPPPEPACTRGTCSGH